MCEWGELLSEISACTKCVLHRSRRNPVPGEGSRSAQVMFIGEAPGAREDETGRPFIGAAGQLLTQLMESIKLQRDSTYITNVVKCRPPSNRDPSDDEIAACLPYLIKQIMLVKPQLIVTLGRHSSRTIYELAGLKWVSMAKQHGKPIEVSIASIRTTVIATYHPASALYNPNLRKLIEDDFRNAIARVISREKESKRTLLDYL
ncbi:MAG: type-4 uracil-DNA glycosylase [Sulfolobales archaeon]|nr:type-4 uracil-DNA glycosylase [Sulfolobales archaeon]MCX8199105.1 type-4 uracil-DNA glycosylase [Sulfolobales archaeon]MDW8170084.1 type-4 uracil-DNA glycosylase [Desulfurococcaceae archaeon]